MRTEDRIHDDVARHYGTAVTTRTPQNPTARLAGHEEAELAQVPADAIASSFGCGNPLAFLGVKEGDVVVDLGSGAGLDPIIAAEKVGRAGRVIGIDMTGEMIAKARANVAAAGAGNVELRKGIVEELPIDSLSADWVISNCAIDLSPEKDRVFREIARVLKRGGQMLVSDIVAEDRARFDLRGNSEPRAPGKEKTAV